MVLPDVNLWLALAFESHVHHESARAWFESLTDDSCGFCRMTQQGFLRLATDPRAFADEAVTMAEAWALYDAFLSDPFVSFADEPPGLEALWRGYTGRRDRSPKVWNDAYLAAFARASGAVMVTFDRGLAQYEGLARLILA